MKRALSLVDVEEAALEALFQRGLKLRLYFAPLVFLGAMSLLALDPAPWRTWLVGVGISVAGLRLGFEFTRVRKHGFQRARLKWLLPVPATLVLLTVGASGGVDSPLVVLLPIVTVFVCLFFKPLYGIIFASSAMCCLWALTAVADHEVVHDFIPQFLGGGPRIPGAKSLLYARAFFSSLALLWAWLVGWVMRNAFQSAIQRALDAREEVLRSHEEGTRALTSLVAEIAHELKNPLASVKGLAELVARSVTGKELERLQVLRRETDRMADILESFLNLSRPLVPLNVDWMNLSVVIQDVASLFEGVANEKRIDFRFDARPDIRVQGDVRKVTQILLNLLHNAIDVTVPAGTIDLVVSQHQGRARILVMDRGPGVIDAERVFTAGVTTKAHGHGLGLTIARGLARQHGGDIQLLPREGGGTIAELSLPLGATST